MPAKPPQSLLVSLADKTHNAEAILFGYRVLDDALWDRFNGGAAGTRWYYRSLANIFSEVMPGRLSDRALASERPSRNKIVRCPALALRITALCADPANLSASTRPVPASQSRIVDARCHGPRREARDLKMLDERA